MLLVFYFSWTVLAYNITPFGPWINFQKRYCVKYNYFMFVSCLLYPAFFHVEIWGPQELLL